MQSYKIIADTPNFFCVKKFTKERIIYLDRKRKRL